MIRGMEKAGIAAVAKHFPGLGYAEGDPHLDLPVIPKEAEEIEEEDILPFRRAVQAGVTGIMIGHGRYPSLSARPASLSRSVTVTLLRERLGFQGLAVTDDMEMGAVKMKRKVCDAAVRACEAGADLLLICHSENDQIASLVELAAAVNNGRIRSDSLKEGVRRLRAVKERVRDRLLAPFRGELEDGPSLAREVAESALTFAGDPAGSSPSAPARTTSSSCWSRRRRRTRPSRSPWGAAASRSG